MKEAFDSGYCTAPRCRTFLEPGQGQQFQRPDGEVDRLCPRHAAEEYREAAAAPEVSR